MLRILVLSLFVYSTCIVCAQNNSLSNRVIKGFVLDNTTSEPSMGVIVYINESQAIETDSNGLFLFDSLEYGTHKIHFMSQDHQSFDTTVTLSGEGLGAHLLTIKLTHHAPITILNDVNIVHKSESQTIRETGFTVNSIDIKPLQSQNLDINKVLNQTSGVRVREQGGLGSDFNFSLNGFSGRQIKFFIDGIPMDNFGTSLSLNNIPVNLVKRVDVYKGVIPVFLGADALGGAVNISTNQEVNRFFDFAYSLGSFNTQRASLIAKQTVGPTKLIVNTRFVYNHSDNNYLTNVQIPDPVSGKLDKYQKVRRFNDGYNALMGDIELGFSDKKWTKKFMLGITASQNRKEIQQGNNMTKPCGEVFTTDKVLIPYLKYEKDSFLLKRLNLSMYVNYVNKKTQVVDTSSKTYNWLGAYTIKQSTNSGELNWDKTLFFFSDQAFTSIANLQYTIHKRYTLRFNNTNNLLTRVGNDPISKNAVPFSQPNSLHKYVSGLSIESTLRAERLKFTLFVKQFVMNSKTFEMKDNDNDVLIELQSNLVRYGKGLAVSYFITSKLLAKSSFENTYRLPDGYEMFGNGLLLEANPRLKPEKSTNFNIGLIHTTKLGKSKLQSEVSYLYRRPQDMIRLSALSVTTKYENLVQARINCMEVAFKYNYNQRFFFECNTTYQDMINVSRYEPDGSVSILYLDRLPNIPYWFANTSLSYSFHNFIVKNSKLSVAVSSHFVDKFYLKWPSQGNASSKFIVPQQLSHDASITYSLKNDRYSCSFGAINFTNKILYDDFMLQKPGRFMSIKLRYSISK